MVTLALQTLSSFSFGGEDTSIHITAHAYWVVSQYIHVLMCFRYKVVGAHIVNVHEGAGSHSVCMLPICTSCAFHMHLTWCLQSCADMYLNSEHKSICMEAIKTCAALLVPSLLPINIYNSPFASFSSASAVVVGDVIKKMLMVGVTSPGV